MSAICGRECSFSVASTTYTSHRFDITLDGEETDVTAFGAGQFGDWVVCRVNGSINASFYENIINVLDVNDAVTLNFTIGTSDLTVAAVVKSVNTGIDAKGIATFNAVFRLTGAITVQGV